MTNRIRWGILGTVKIARQFAVALRQLPGAESLAVGSRSAQAAQRFADEFGIARCYGSYADLANDPETHRERREQTVWLALTLTLSPKER